MYGIYLVKDKSTNKILYYNYFNTGPIFKEKLLYDSFNFSAFIHKYNSYYHKLELFPFFLAKQELIESLYNLNEIYKELPPINYIQETIDIPKKIVLIEKIEKNYKQIFNLVLKELILKTKKIKPYKKIIKKRITPDKRKEYTEKLKQNKRENAMKYYGKNKEKLKKQRYENYHRNIELSRAKNKIFDLKRQEQKEKFKLNRNNTIF